MNFTLLRTMVFAEIIKLQEAMVSMNEVNAGQKNLRDGHPQFYVERVHAMSLALHLQGIYAGAERILKAVIEQVDGRIPTNEEWSHDLLEITAADVIGVRGALISRQTHEDMKKLLAFRRLFWTTPVREVPSSLVFEMVEVAHTGIGGLVEDVRALLGPAPR